MRYSTIPGTLSLASHILLREVGRPFQLNVLEPGEHRVATLELGNGERLCEPCVTGQYICDAAFRLDLMPGQRTLARYRVIEWQGFVAAELKPRPRKPIGGPATPEARWLKERLAHVEASLDAEYLTGNRFTAADALFFAAAQQWDPIGGCIRAMPRLSEYLARIADRPSASAALAAEARPATRRPASGAATMKLFAGALS